MIVLEQLMSGIERDLQKQPHVKDCINPSSASQYSDGVLIGACPRSVWFSMMGYEGEPLTWKNGLIFARGVQYEKYMQSRMEKEGILLGSNIRYLDQERKVRGEIDAIVKDSSGTTRGIEFKTIDSDFASKAHIQDKGSLPKDSAILQVMCYLDFLLRNKITIDYTKNLYSLVASDNGELINRFSIIVAHTGYVECKEYDVFLTKIWREDIKTEDLSPVIDGKILNNFSLYDMLQTHNIILKCIENKIPPDIKYCNDYSKNEDAAKRSYSNYKNLVQYKSKTYEKWRMDNNCDFQCKMCPFFNHCMQIDQKK